MPDWLERLIEAGERWSARVQADPSLFLSLVWVGLFVTLAAIVAATYSLERILNN